MLGGSPRVHGSLLRQAETVIFSADDLPELQGCEDFDLRGLGDDDVGTDSLLCIGQFVDGQFFGMNGQLSTVVESTGKDASRSVLEECAEVCAERVDNHRLLLEDHGSRGEPFNRSLWRIPTNRGLRRSAKLAEISGSPRENLTTLQDKHTISATLVCLIQIHLQNGNDVVGSGGNLHNGVAWSGIVDDFAVTGGLDAVDECPAAVDVTERPPSIDAAHVCQHEGRVECAHDLDNHLGGGAEERAERPRRIEVLVGTVAISVLRWPPELSVAVISGCVNSAVIHLDRRVHAAECCVENLQSTGAYEHVDIGADVAAHLRPFFGKWLEWDTPVCGVAPVAPGLATPIVAPDHQTARDGSLREKSDFGVERETGRLPEPGSAVARGVGVLKVWKTASSCSSRR